MDTRERIAKVLSSLTDEPYETYLDVIMGIIAETHVSLDTEIKEWEVAEETQWNVYRVQPATVRDFIEGREVRKK